MQDTLKPFFDAAGVAVIGASNSPRKLGYGIVKNLTLYGYKGKIYPVNHKEDKILGLEAYPNIKEVPDPVDLAVLVLPANFVLPIIKDCHQRGIKAITVISGGFKELGREGKAQENEIVRFVKENKIRMVGPNCVGTMSLHSGMNTTFISGVPEKGSIGFLSQSGAVMGGIVDFVRNKGIGFSHFISMGNEADVTETDMIEYLGNDPQTSVIAAYVEEIRDGKRFMEVASKVSLKKPIVILKSGKTRAGARAVSSHTGSLAGSHSAYQAAFTQCGVIEVQTINELFDVSQAFALQKPPRGKRVAIVTNAGGPAALLSDSLASNGFSLANLSKDTSRLLQDGLNPSAQTANPVDMLGGAEPKDFELALELLAKDPNVDIIVPILVPQALVDPVEVAEKIAVQAEKSDKTMIAVFIGDSHVVKPRLLLHGRKVPMVVFPEGVGTILSSMAKYVGWQKKVKPTKIKHSTADQELARNLLAEARINGVMGEAQTRPLLKVYGIRVIQGRFARNEDEAVQWAGEIGYPVVMKISSPDILHKSDVGGIRLGVVDEGALRNSFQSMMAEVRQKAPAARLDGVLIQETAPAGQGVIIGMKRDHSFGPVMMFGMGGIFVELYKDVTFRVAPLSKKDAIEMINETKTAKLLMGYRGIKKLDVDSVVDALIKLSQISMDHQEIEEIEINPLLVHEKGSVALDGRVILK